MSPTLKAMDDLYALEIERIERGPFVWIGNHNFMEAVRERFPDEDLMQFPDDGVCGG